MDLEKRFRAKILAGIESECGVLLPKRYREFVLSPSNEVSSALTGSDYKADELLAIQEGARVLLNENGNPFELRREDFVILLHQGYQFLFIPCDHGEDPPIYYWLEGDDAEPVKVHESVSEWISVMEKE